MCFTFSYSLPVASLYYFYETIFMHVCVFFFHLQMQRMKEKKNLSLHIDLRWDYDTCNVEERTRFKSVTHPFVEWKFASTASLSTSISWSLPFCLCHILRNRFSMWFVLESLDNYWCIFHYMIPIAHAPCTHLCHSEKESEIALWKRLVNSDDIWIMKSRGTIFVSSWMISEFQISCIKLHCR